MSGLEFAVSPPYRHVGAFRSSDWGSVASLGILSLRLGVSNDELRATIEKNTSIRFLHRRRGFAFAQESNQRPARRASVGVQQPALTMCPNCAKYDLRSSCDHEGGKPLTYTLSLGGAFAFAFTSSVSPSVFANLTSSVFPEYSNR